MIRTAVDNGASAANSGANRRNDVVVVASGSVQREAVHIQRGVRGDGDGAVVGSKRLIVANLNHACANRGAAAERVRTRKFKLTGASLRQTRRAGNRRADGRGLACAKGVDGDCACERKDISRTRIIIQYPARRSCGNRVAKNNVANRSGRIKVNRDIAGDVQCAEVGGITAVGDAVAPIACDAPVAAGRDIPSSVGSTGSYVVGANIPELNGVDLVAGSAGGATVGHRDGLGSAIRNKSSNDILSEAARRRSCRAADIVGQTYRAAASAAERDYARGVITAPAVVHPNLHLI